MTRLFLARHGQTAWNAIGRIQGTADIELDETGLAQAERLADSLAPRLGDEVAIVASSLSRAGATAAPLAARLGVKVARDARLIERAYGVWEGLTPAEREERDPEEAVRWAAHETPRIDGYEQNEQVVARSVAAVTDAIAEARGDVVVVSHASTLRVLMDALLGWPVGQRTATNLDNGAWSLLESRDDRWTLVRHNVTGD